MEGAELELERRSKFLTGLIEKKKAQEQQEQHTRLNVRVRAADMPLAVQNRAFSCARDLLDSMPGKIDSKRLALALKKFSENGEFEAKCGSLVRFGFRRRLLLGQNFLPKDFDSAYGPAWHCIVGTSFGSYVTHSIGGFLYFSIDKVYILLFKTAVEPLDH